ncbi:MAG: LysM peptidoglycan-binding domain-containing protein [Caldilineaceae bacterium]
MSALLWSGGSNVSASTLKQEPPTGVEADGAPTTTAPPYNRRQAYTVQDPDAYVHTVRPGESWIRIAQQYGLEYPALRDANPELWSLRYTVIRPGDQMVIPNHAASEMPGSLSYTVQYRDSWYKIAEHFGISYGDLRVDNLTLWHRRGIYIRPGDVLIVNGATQNVDAGQPRTAEDNAEVQAASDETTAEVTEAEAPAAVEEAPAAADSNALPSTGGSGPYLVGQLPKDTVLYTVRPGDTWFAVAAANGISFIDLRVLNAGLWTARGQSLRVGDQMIVPANAEPIPPDIRSGPAETATPAVAEPTAEPSAPPASEPPADAERPTPAPEAEAPSVDAPSEEAPSAEDAAVEAPAPEGEGEAAEPAADTAPAAGDAAAASRADAAVESGAETDANAEVDADSERGPMQPVDQNATRLRIDVAPPTILYVVQPGDDWAAVAAKAGVSVSALQAANPALSGRALQPGDNVRFP